MPLIDEFETWSKRLTSLPLASYGPGETVLAEGSTTRRLMILKRGAVTIGKEGISIAMVSEPGAIFGELAALLDQPHTADVRTVGDSEFYIANAASLLEQDSVALLYVAALLARRLDLANHSLIELKSALQQGQSRNAIDTAVSRLQGILGAIGDGYIRAGAGLSIFPSG